MFYLMMIPHVEDDATITSDIDELSSIVVPNRSGWSEAKVGRVVAELQAKGLFQEYEGLFYLPPKSFYKYQSSIPEAKRRTWQPEPSEQEKSCSDEEQKNILKSAENSASPSPSPSPSKHLSSSALDEFACFWQEYPRKEGKGKARESFLAARRKVGSAAIMAGLADQRGVMAAKEMRYIPLPATWLNQERWSDEIEDGPPGQPRVDPHARETRIANARTQLAGGMEPELARGMVKDDLEWQEVMKSAIG